MITQSLKSLEPYSPIKDEVGINDFDDDPLLASPESGIYPTSASEGIGKSAQNGNIILAAVDMGTNSFHMVVVRADKQGRFQVMDSEKETVRLGSGSPDLSVEVLAGMEEACLIYNGVLEALSVYNKTVLVVDIGGGSTEIILGNAGKPIYATSLKLGHVRQSEQFPSLGEEKDGLKKDLIEELIRHIRVILADSGVIDQVKTTPFEVAIGSSGTIESIEQMIHHAVTTSNDSQATDPKLLDREFTADELSQAVKKICKAKTSEQRAKIPGLPSKRADVIVAGAVLLEEIFLAFGLKSMLVSPYALREGVIVNTLAETFASYQPGVNVRSSSIHNLALKFNTGRRMESAQHSALLAKQILAGLQSCRSGSTEYVPDVAGLLNNDDAELLEAATILHFVGMFINHRSYHKHSYYLVKNTEHLLGFSTIEIEILALLVRYHRKKAPSQKKFARLPEKSRKKVQAMCAVMRVAVALDRCNSSAIQYVHISQQTESIVLAVVPATDAATGNPYDVSLEIWAAQQELPYFETIFKRRASIIVSDGDDVKALCTKAPSERLSLKHPTPV
ncbi:uncharacterized protein [Physcomitrium patens]|uniref:Ppx/GppA phosphatase domain-containing protein n=1 Tax=Physcomitrium patens TaxID=3218 RepID=A0A7I4D146_PHYPA|nr:uncharacterized protein LOC112278303 isoform X2 [Physcomitrium patens]|eukprot:XP_024367336.1 uncharacterized protein LOC112278303 isoform X2 [Physcomitrella patens]